MRTASPPSYFRNESSRFETPVTTSATTGGPLPSKMVRLSSRSLPRRVTLAETTEGVQPSTYADKDDSTRAVVDCGRAVGDGMDKSLVMGSGDLRNILEVVQSQLRHDILTELQEDVDKKIAKMQRGLDEHFARCIVQLQEVTAERERTMHQKISKLEAAVLSGLDEIQTMSKSFGEMANELEEGIKQAMQQNTMNSGIEGDELRCFMQQLSEEKVERDRSGKLREDVTRNFVQLQQEFQDAFAQVAVLGAERDKQDSKISNLEVRLNLKIAQVERTLAASLADMNGFRQSPMALVGAREKQRLVGEIEEKLKQATTGMETEIASLREEVECLHKETHHWQEPKKLSAEQSDASSTQFDPSDPPDVRQADPYDPSEVSEDGWEDYFVSEAPTNSHIPFLILVP